MVIDAKPILITGRNENPNSSPTEDMEVLRQIYENPQKFITTYLFIDGYSDELSQKTLHTIGNLLQDYVCRKEVQERNKTVSYVSDFIEKEHESFLEFLNKTMVNSQN